LNLAQRSIGH